MLCLMYSLLLVASSIMEHLELHGKLASWPGVVGVAQNEPSVYVSNICSHWVSLL